MNSTEKLKEYKILSERPNSFGGSLICKINANTHDVFSLFENIHGEYEDLFKDFNWIDSKTNWQWFLELKNGIVRLYDSRGSVSIGSVGDILVTISDELKEEVDELRLLIEQAVLELPREHRSKIDAEIDANPFKNFCETYDPVMRLIDRSKENGSLLEGLVLTTSLIDALLRNCLVLQNQIDNSNAEIDEIYIYQRGRSYISERNIFKEVHDRKIISADLFKQISDFYDERNKAVHRYFISNFQYMDIQTLLNKNLNIVSDLMKVLYEIEEEQIKLKVGITVRGSKNDDISENNSLSRVDSELKRVIEISEPEVTSIFEDPKFIDIIDTYHMRLDPEPFEKIKNGEKDIELRLYDKKRKKYSAGDPLFFVNTDDEFSTFSTKIKKIIIKDKFSDIFEDGISQQRAGFRDDDNVDVLMQKYYTPEQISECGVVGIVLDTFGERIDKLRRVIKGLWSKDTCYEPQQDDWSSDNPSLGQCYVTTLIINDYFGGELVKVKSSSGASHYWNRINGKDVDLTREQFPENELFTDLQVIQRENIVENERYEILKEKVSQEYKEL